MIRYYVPWTTRHQQVVDAVPSGTIWLDVRGDDDAYWRALCDIWAKGEDFAIIEHDVIPRGFEQFDQCPEPWCTFGYANICHPECQEAWANQLGFTRFRAEVMAKCPDALTSIPKGERNWHNLCDSIAGNKTHGVDRTDLRPHSLRAAGLTHHWHFPPVEHHPWMETA